MAPTIPFERSSGMARKIDAQKIDAQKIDARKIDIPLARFGIGEVVRHKIFDFRGVIFDVDPVFANSEEWYESIPEAIRPSRDQPFYHLLAENTETAYVAYVSQQNLVPDESEEPIDHPGIPAMFDRLEGGRYQLRPEHRH